MNKAVVKDKKEFMQQYVLNRALAHKGGLSGIWCVEQAEKAWYAIERRCKDEPYDA